VFNEYPDLTITGYIVPQEKISIVTSWDAVIRLLQKFHGDQTKVAVYPNSEIQYCATC